MKHIKNIFLYLCLLFLISGCYSTICDVSGMSVVHIEKSTRKGYKYFYTLKNVDSLNCYDPIYVNSNEKFELEDIIKLTKSNIEKVENE